MPPATRAAAISATGVFPHTTGTGVLSLMALHPVAAAFAIAALDFYLHTVKLTR